MNTIYSNNKFFKKFIISFLFILSVFILAGCSTDKVKEITVDKTSVTIQVGEEVTVKATVDPEGALENNPVEWKSSSAAVATVVDGIITGQNAGTATITATAGDKTATVAVTVEAPKPVTGITLDKTIVDLNKGQKATVVATISPDNATNKTVTWTTENAAIATVNNGEITAVAQGTTFIVATAGDVSVKVRVKVTDLTIPTGLELNATSVDVDVDKTVTVIATPYPATAKDAVVTWTIDKEDIATVANGVITGVKEGTAVVTATSGEYSDTVKVIVTDPKLVKGLKFSETVARFGIGETYTPGLEITPITASDAVLEWTSENPAIATVANGVISGIALGETVITVSGNGFTAEITVNVNNDLVYHTNGGNFTYPFRIDMVNDFLTDYNRIMEATFTYEQITDPANAWRTSAWGLVSFDKFFYAEGMRAKWGWIPAYLGRVGSNTNKAACKRFATQATQGGFNGDGNAKYALSYEVRAFLGGFKFTANANWMSNDYSVLALRDGFWDEFSQLNDELIVSITDPVTLETNAYRDGYTFVGWYTNPELTGDPITVATEKIDVYAKWDIYKPVTALEFTNGVATMNKGDALKLEVGFTPADAYDKTISFKTSNEKIIRVDTVGNIIALNPGTATITVTSSVTGVEATVTIEVAQTTDINVAYSEGFNGSLLVGEETTITVTGVGTLEASDFVFTSLNTDILTVDTNGLIKAIALGTGTISVRTVSSEDVLVTVTITVIAEPADTQVDKLLQLLIDSNFAVVDSLNASLYYDDGSAKQQYYDATYGSVNLFLFDKLNMNYDYQMDPKATGSPNSGLLDSTEFITIHDTANLNGGLTNHGKYFKGTTAVSIHYAVGDDGVITSMPDTYKVWHAGDGTGTKFEWQDTGIAAEGNLYPTTDISTDGYFTFNDKKSVIVAPTKDGMILDNSYFPNTGLNWKIGDNGNYFLGTTWFNTSQNARGIISSRGGNNNSIGIEMCVNTDGDIYDTWQRTAKLVGGLMIAKELDLSRVVQHNNFSGKNCPSSLIMTNYWNTFKDMVALENLIQSEYKDATISMVSNNPELLDNTGRIIGMPATATAVTYDVTVKVGDVEKTVTLGSVVPGTNSWHQYNGMFSTR